MEVVLQMSAKTIHVIPKNGGWAVRKEQGAKRRSSLYPTQKEAIEAALDMVHRMSAGQLVIHHRENTLVPVERGRSAAEAIADARFVEVGGMDSMAWAREASSLSKHGSPSPAGRLRTTQVTVPPMESFASR